MAELEGFAGWPSSGSPGTQQSLACEWEYLVLSVAGRR